MTKKKDPQDLVKNKKPAQSTKKAEKVPDLPPESPPLPEESPKSGVGSPGLPPPVVAYAELKAKLRRKYVLLRHEPLNFDDRELLLNHVCEVLGMNRPSLDVVLLDL